MTDVLTDSEQTSPAPQPALLVTQGDQIVVADPSACELLRLPQGDLVGTKAVAVGVPVFTGAEHGRARLAHRTGHPIDVSYDVRRVEVEGAAFRIWRFLPRARPERRPDGDRLRVARALRLTERELEVAQLIADGLGNRDIARELTVSLETVKSHVRRLLAKLAARSRAHAVGVAWRMNLVD
jgi:DNA-binding CsgD family transcriptional regulator